jgi:flavin-dependent dehydrogenase
MNATRTWDAVIAGGGPAGSIAALVLARAGRRVLLADEERDAAKIGEALPPAARPLLHDLGLAHVLDGAHGLCPGNVSAWGSGDLRQTDFIFSPYGHGCHLDRGAFDAALRATAQDAGAEIVRGARVECRGGLRLRRKGGEQPLTSRWIVDATGRAATVARAHGARRASHDPLVAFHARLVTQADRDRDGRTLVEASQDGWWYTARVSTSERVVAYLTDRDVASQTGRLSAATFGRRVRETTHVRRIAEENGYVVADGVRGAHAGSSRLDIFCGDGWIAAGDAAMAFDPLSSQGLYNAIYTGMRAGESVNAALDGRTAALTDYVARLETIYAAYGRHLRAYYAMETRWPARTFWARRSDRVLE